jgi:hypothetical protein
MKKKQDKKAILSLVSFLKIKYKPRGTNEYIRGKIILKTHVISIAQIFEKMDASITMLNIALTLDEVV